MAIPTDDAALTQAIENHQALNLNEIRTLVQAALAIAKPHVMQDHDLDGVLEGMLAAHKALERNYLIVSVAICALRHKKPEEIVTAMVLIWQTIQDINAGKFLAYRNVGQA